MVIPQRMVVIAGLILLPRAWGWGAGTTSLTILHTSYDMGYVDPAG